MQEPDRCAAPAEAAGDGAAGDAPLAFVTKVRNAPRLAAVDARALALGIVPGLTLADARARQPDLVAVGMDESADRHWLDDLARQCMDFSPLVSLARPDGITIDITGVAHLFGSAERLAEAVEDRLAQAGMTLRRAIAATADAAQALARHACASDDADERTAIRALPVEALGLDPLATVGLQRAGLKTVGDVAVRPAASIAARFGAGAVAALHGLTGDAGGSAPRPLVTLAPRVPLRFERRFAEPVTHQDTIARTLLDLLHEAAAALAGRALGGRGFRLMLFRSDGAKRRLDIATSAPTRDPALVLRLFDERIATLADPLDPGFGYDSMTLTVRVAEPLEALQPALDCGGSGEAGPDADAVLAELIDRLSTRLGPDCLRRLAPRASHIPEQGQLALPAIHGGAPLRWPAPPPGEPPMRPLFLFDPPQPVEVIAAVPDGPPHRFRWRRKSHEVRLYEGPERIAAEWWKHRGGEHDGKGSLTRDYYRIEDVRGRRYWLFRHGLYDEKPDPRWYLHGLFA
nr:DNA polymerase Y family protein [Novosphingobium lentum]